MRPELRAGIDPGARHAGEGHSAPTGRRRAKARTPRISRWSDRFGKRSSNTYTLNFSYGLGLVAEGTGVLLNNELDDFAAKPGAPNAYGLVGGDANAPGPRKRPLSSMTPDHRAQGRQAVTGHRFAGRLPHHHRGAAGHHQCDRQSCRSRQPSRRRGDPRPVVARRTRGGARPGASN